MGQNHRPGGSRADKRAAQAPHVSIPHLEAKYIGLVVGPSLAGSGQTRKQNGKFHHGSTYIARVVGIYPSLCENG